VFDGALVDIRMPRMSGIEMLKEIKRHDPSIEVIRHATKNTFTEGGRAMLSSGR
jgi:DNA-binding NarL/FixJ family response regulator